MTDKVPALFWTGTRLQVKALAYQWIWETGTDRVTVLDRRGDPILSATLQPLVESVPVASSPKGSLALADVADNRLVARYSGVNDTGELSLEVRFEQGWFVNRILEYHSHRQERIVSVNSFCDCSRDGVPAPNGESDFVFVPGGGQFPEQYTFATPASPNARFTLGAFSIGSGSTFFQQPFLPHYLFAAFNRRPSGKPGFSVSRQVTDAICIGLGAIPDGMATLEIEDGKLSPRIEYRGDLWGHKSGPGEIDLSVPWVGAPGGDWKEALAGYFRALRVEGMAPAKDPSEVPRSAFWPQFNTWGEQVERGATERWLTEPVLESIYDDYRGSGLEAKLFVIDALWESRSGSMEHCRKRFPNFEAFLARIRGDGMEVGLWVAFPRCEEPAGFGLDAGALLRDSLGAPLEGGFGDARWNYLDPTDPGVERHLRERMAALVKRYRPKLLKLDFGYEIPPLGRAAPADRRWAGERTYLKFLDTIVPAVKAIDHEVTIQYYSLSPLLAGYHDQLSFDDLWLSGPKYRDAFNKRAAVASLCGGFGVVPYGSSGYDWSQTPGMWLESVVVGIPGSLAPLSKDPPAGVLAKFNGASRLVRFNSCYSVRSLTSTPAWSASSPTVDSWVRLEEGLPVLALIGSKGGGPWCDELFESDGPVLVSSLGRQPLGTSSRLGVVSAGCRRIRFRDREGDRVKVHLFGGAEGEWERCSQEPDGFLVEIWESVDGTPVELFEVVFR